MHIINIVEETVENIRQTADITNIIDNNNGSYNIYADTSELIINDYVTISDTENFNGEHKVISIEPTYFNILLESGKNIITIGLLTLNRPYFHYAKFDELANWLVLANKDENKKYQKFP